MLPAASPTKRCKSYSVLRMRPMLCDKTIIKNRKKRCSMKRIQRGIALLFGVMLLAVLALVLFAYDGTAFWLKRTYLLSQPAMLATGLAAMSALCGVIYAAGRFWGRRWPRWTALIPWAGLLGVQLALSFRRIITRELLLG